MGKAAGGSPRGRFRPWPKKHDGMRFVIDKDKIREEYLASPHYAWAEFCKENNYNPHRRAEIEFPVKAWQQQWLHRQSEGIEESLMSKAVQAKRFISEQRLAFPKEWNDTAKSMKSLADFMLQRAVADAAWDQQNESFLRSNPHERRFKLQPRELATIALAQARIQELHLRSLLMPSADAYKAAIPIRETDAEVVEAEQEEARLKAIPAVLVGGGTLDEHKMTQILDRWIDQSAKAGEALAASSPDEATLEDLDQPLTPPEGTA